MTVRSPKTTRVAVDHPSQWMHVLPIVAGNRRISLIAVDWSRERIVVDDLLVTSTGSRLSEHLDEQTRNGVTPIIISRLQPVIDAWATRVEQGTGLALSALRTQRLGCLTPRPPLNLAPLLRPLATLVHRRIPLEIWRDSLTRGLTFTFDIRWQEDHDTTARFTLERTSRDDVDPSVTQQATAIGLRWVASHIGLAETFESLTGTITVPAPSAHDLARSRAPRGRLAALRDA